MEDTQGKTVGEILRGAREEKKLTIEQVNRETRISIATLRALEGDDFDAFSSDTYLKGFLRSYSDFLGLDSANLWNMLRNREGAAPGGGPSWEVEEALHVERIGPPRILRRLIVPLMVVVIVILVVLLARERRRSDAVRSGSAATVEAVRSAG